ncbi:hypothetical protein CEP54_012710 [Fusarium duplospermum]|uniref:Uncharacterized protein n=1 Tax=Fusarium duplospermum TaxID=1325734 RepID=A0A428P7A2_9HYPO|nr:hypothetical protein CEP54_012710 [Fusarium duplospermum]
MVNGNWRLQVYGPPPPAASTRCYPTKLRWAPPNAISEYPTPGRTQFLGSPQRQQQHLPSPPPTLRWPTHPPRHQDLRRTHCDDGRTIYKQEPYSQHPHCTYPFYRLPFGLPPSSSRQNYSNVTGGLYEIPQVTPGNTTRARKGGARKRASIACQACRKRKVCVGNLHGDTGD